MAKRKALDALLEVHAVSTANMRVLVAVRRGATRCDAMRSARRDYFFALLIRGPRPQEPEHCEPDKPSESVAGDDLGSSDGSDADSDAAAEELTEEALLGAIYPVVCRLFAVCGLSAAFLWFAVFAQLVCSLSAACLQFAVCAQQTHWPGLKVRAPGPCKVPEGGGEARRHERF